MNIYKDIFQKCNKRASSARTHLFRALLCLGLTGCTGLGPMVLPPDRYGLNESLRLSDNQQLLLNIVRVRYSDPPYFLGVSTITSVFNVNYSANGTADYNKTDDTATATSLSPFSNITKTITRFYDYSITPGIGYSQTPTVSYSPLQGEIFTRQLLSPISIDQYFLLTSPAWGGERVMRLTLQSVGSYDNSTTPTDENRGNLPYKKFNEISHLLHTAQEKKIISVRIEKLESYFSFIVTIEKDKANTPEAKRLLAAFKQSPNERTLHFVPSSVAKTNETENDIPVTTRSIMGMLLYLSHGVQVPMEDIINHRVDTYRLSDGKLFDWTETTRGMLCVKSSKTRPPHPAIMVRYRGLWFYVDDYDVNSKKTLALLSEIFALRAGNVQNVIPPLLSLRV